MRPEPFSIAFAVLVLACVAAFLRPTVGVYLIVFLTLIGDTVTTAWWPFTKNMSSRESIFFVHDSLPQPARDRSLVVTTVAWLLRRLADPTWRFRAAACSGRSSSSPASSCSALLRGIATGGDTRVAIFEARPLLYIPLVYILVTNLLETRRSTAGSC